MRILPAQNRSDVPTGLIMTLLPSTWTYDFLDAPLSSPPAPELRLVYPPPYFCFFTAVSDASINAAVDLVREVIEEDGPYDAVIGFSQVGLPMP